MNETDEKFFFTQAPDWAMQISDKELVGLVQETDFSEEMMNDGKDFCYLRNCILNYTDKNNSDYSILVYSLSQPRNMEVASVEDVYLEEFSTLFFHRIAVIRNGEYIDKMPDTRIKVFDSEEQSRSGVYSNSKKINISIQDLRLHDTIVIERTQENTYGKKEVIRNQFMKSVSSSPDVYWGYAHYQHSLLNNTSKPIAFQRFFFRDEQGNVIPSEKEIIKPGGRFDIHYENYTNPVDANREIYSFIDFATDSDWRSISNFVYPLYEAPIREAAGLSFAPELRKELDAIGGLEHKIKWAIEYVQNQIKYIYDAAEMNGHKPQPAGVTYQSKQGDCKAKSLLLKVLLDYIGVSSDIILVNYRADFYMKYYLPSPLSFNHVIVRIEHNGNEYFIDPTITDEKGLLENRSFIQFYHYLRIAADADLSYRKPHRYAKYCLDEIINYHVKEGKGYIELQSIYRYNRANNIRAYFKNTNKREILDSWMNSLFYCLNFVSDRKIEDIRTIFTQPEIKIENDDPDLNELTIRFRAELLQPYFTDIKGQQFLMYFDHNVLKNNVRDFNSRDYTFWHGFESERYEINISTDLDIDTKERYTIQEADIQDEYFHHVIKKNIHKHGGSAYITYDPVTNVEIPQDKIGKLKEDYHKVADSNFGLGIDIVKPGVGNMIKRSLSKWLGK